MSKPVTDRGGSQFPGVLIGNGELEMHVCIPDSEEGYYRGPRFDWSGHIAQARLHDHTFFDEWQTPHDPIANDHAIGPADEFGMEEPLGYSDANPGEPFIKIGVGVLRKPDGEAYDFAADYEIVEPGKWDIDCDARQVSFRQQLSHRQLGYAYTKTIRATDTPNIFTISRTLANTGDDPIRTNHYCHNFFILDGRPVCDEYLLRFAFQPRFGLTDADRKVAELEGNDLVFTEALKPDEAFYCRLLDFAGTTHNDFEVINSSTQTRARVVGDAPPVRMVVYAVAATICVEPFIDIELSPGESHIWTNTYELTT